MFITRTVIQSVTVKSYELVISRIYWWRINRCDQLSVRMLNGLFLFSSSSGSDGQSSSDARHLQNLPASHLLKRAWSLSVQRAAGPAPASLRWSSQTVSWPQSSWRVWVWEDQMCHDVTAPPEAAERLDCLLLWRVVPSFHLLALLTRGLLSLLRLYCDRFDFVTQTVNKVSWFIFLSVFLGLRMFCEFPYLIEPNERNRVMWPVV